MSQQESKTQLIEHVKSGFWQPEKSLGYTDPKAVAASITATTQGELYEDIYGNVHRMPTEGCLYEGALETIIHLLKQKDGVAIWSQGDQVSQLWKLVNSGVGEELVKNLTKEQLLRFSVFADKDKVTPFPNVIKLLQEQDFTKFVLVDDKAKNILEMESRIAKAKEKGEIAKEVEIDLVWINQGRSKDETPKGYSLEAFKDKFTTIEDIGELQKIKAAKNGQIGWILDLDHTLLNTSAAREIMFAKIADAIEESHPAPIVSYSYDLKHRLNGNVKGVEVLLSGMSGGKVLKVTTDKDLLVIKHNPENPEKIKRERDGYDKLLKTPLASHMLIPMSEYSLGEDSVIAIPYFPGIQLRKGIQSESLPEELAFKTVAELLSIKRQWWANQPKQFDQDYISMQKEEWQDTLLKINETFDAISKKLNVPLEALWNSPIMFHDHEYPSLLNTIAVVNEFLKLPPPYTVLTHGDATGANIIVNPENKNWAMFDTEWVGYADPAEPYVRMIKYISTTTIKKVQGLEAKFINGRLVLDLDLLFPQMAIDIQNYGLYTTKQFAASLSDTDFPRRVSMYLTGSYLRELALISRRYPKNPELGLFAMLKAAEAIECQHC